VGAVSYSRQGLIQSLYIAKIVEVV
jgi:hypothetical protein